MACPTHPKVKMRKSDYKPEMICPAKDPINGNKRGFCIYTEPLPEDGPDAPELEIYCPNCQQRFVGV